MTQLKNLNPSIDFFHDSTLFVIDIHKKKVNFTCFNTILPLSLSSPSVIEKSLDLEKISRRNDSCFSLSSWRIVFSFLFLFSIFKIFRQQISFFSRFARFLKSILFLFSIFKIVKTKVSFYSRFMRLCSLFLFLFL